LRRQDWRPRAVRQDSHRQRDALRALTRSLGREPNEQEAAAALGLSLDEYQQYLLAESAEEMLSFDEILQEAVGAEQHTPGPEDAYMVRRSLEQALGALNDKEQRYKEIAAVLDLSDARVCQLNKSALAKMKTALRRD
jgi:RNA polymerase sigma factor for flagellar operon FliA